MVAAWQAASARYPQVTSLDDPMFLSMMAPASIGSKNVPDFGYRLEISQKIPWCGKLALRGQNALAEADAAHKDVEDVRLQLAESALTSFYDYYLVARIQDVNEEGLRLLREFSQNAETRYRTGLVTQQDVLQAEVEIGRQQERLISLERMRRVAVARLNTLMHLPPDTPLPRPPAQVGLPRPLPDVAVLHAQALANRPDLRALGDRVAAEKAQLGLALKEFCPDVEVIAAYDTMMGNGPMRDLAPQVGVRVYLPVRKARRYGAVAEAEARIALRQAELAKRTDEINFEVRQGYEQVRESERIVRLYANDLLPAAANNVKAAQSAYITGKIPFLSLVEAQRNVISLRDRFYEATADYHRRLATLERVVGAPVSPGIAGK
jgi:outer membrane protein TolC